ncbi:MAG: class I SAM-dependent methyltransferase [Rickettsiales bacterium]|nr:class I SAM-dependent methyltransferase [Rickettsiales bacterium]
MDKKTDPTAEGKNFLNPNFGFFSEPKVIADIVNPISERTIESMDNQPNTIIHVLDMGTGTGIIVKNLKQKLNLPERNGFQPVLYYGIDCQDDLIQQNKKDAPDITWFCADNKSIPFADNFFDVVFMRGAFHYEDTKQAQEQVIKQAFCALKPGGYLINYSVAFRLASEADLENRFYKILPKSVRWNTIADFYGMHKKVFKNAKFLPNPNSRSLDFTAESMRNRYHFDTGQQQAICDMIAAVPKEKRPHFDTDGTNFWFTNPQRIIQCQKLK